MPVLNFIRKMFSPVHASIVAFAINNSRFRNFSHRFGEILSDLVIDGGRVKFLRLIFFDI